MRGWEKGGEPGADGGGGLARDLFVGEKKRKETSDFCFFWIQKGAAELWKVHVCVYASQQELNLG